MDSRDWEASGVGAGPPGVPGHDDTFLLPPVYLITLTVSVCPHLGTYI